MTKSECRIRLRSSVFGIRHLDLGIHSCLGISDFVISADRGTIAHGQLVPLDTLRHTHRALPARGLRATSSSVGRIGLRVSTWSRGSSRHASLTRRSSSEWKLMIASLPPLAADPAAALTRARATSTRDSPRFAGPETSVWPGRCDGSSTGERNAHELRQLARRADRIVLPLRDNGGSHPR